MKFSNSDISNDDISVSRCLLLAASEPHRLLASRLFISVALVWKQCEWLIMWVASLKVYLLS